MRACVLACVSLDVCGLGGVPQAAASAYGKSTRYQASRPPAPPLPSPSGAGCWHMGRHGCLGAGGRAADGRLPVCLVPVCGARMGVCA